MAESNLEELYEFKEKSEKLGLVLGEDLLAQLKEREDELIRTEVIPVIHESIEPALRPVRRKLVLVVEYDPDEGLQVRVSRKVNVTKMMADAKVLTPDPIVQHQSQLSKDRRQQINPRTGLCITLNGETICESTGKDTLAEFVRRVGAERVRSVGITCCGIPLVSNRRDPKYGPSQTEVGRGWLLVTNSSTREKCSQVERIAQALRLNCHVEIIK